MQFGAAMFFTDYSMGAADLARALEARGFESVWAPEHSHIPTSRRSPYQAGGELPTSPTICRSSKRWRQRWGAIPGKCR